MKQIISYVRMGIIDAISYRLDVLGFVVGGVARPLAFLAVWLSVLASGGNVPLDRGQLIQYYLGVLVVGQIAGAWAAPFLASDIRLGKISPRLLKPTYFIGSTLGNNIGEKVVKLIYTIPLAFLLLFLFRVEWSIDLVRFGLFVPSVLLAAGLFFLINTCVGLLGFWTDEASAFDDFLDLFLYFFSGRLFPLAILPIFIQSLADVLPFRYTLSFPLEILLGQLDSYRIITGFAWQIVWLVFFVFLYRVMFHFGVRRYSAVGA